MPHTWWEREREGERGREGGRVTNHQSIVLSNDWFDWWQSKRQFNDLTSYTTFTLRHTYVITSYTTFIKLFLNHLWINNTRSFVSNSRGYSISIVVHFRRTLLSNETVNAKALHGPRLENAASNHQFKWRSLRIIDNPWKLNTHTEILKWDIENEVQFEFVAWGFSPTQTWGLPFTPTLAG